MDNSAKAAMTLSLTLSSLSVCVLITGIVITELNDSKKIFINIITLLEAIYYIAAICGIVIAHKAYNSWKAELYFKRTIEIDEKIQSDIELLKDAILDVILEASKGFKNKSDNEMEITKEDIMKKQKVMEGAFSKISLTAKKPLINKDIEKILYSILSLSHKPSILLQDWLSRVNDLSKIKEDIEFFRKIIVKENSELTMDELDKYRVEMAKMSESIDNLQNSKNLAFESLYEILENIREKDKELAEIRINLNKSLKY